MKLEKQVKVDVMVQFSNQFNFLKLVYFFKTGFIFFKPVHFFFEPVYFF